MIIKKHSLIVSLAAVLMTTGFPAAYAAPDLIVSEFYHPSEVAIGEPFTATVTIVNQGVDDVVTTDTVYYSVFLSSDESLGDGDICTGYGAIVHPYAHLTAGSGFFTDHVILQVNAENTTAGSYYLIASADSLCGSKRMTESDESNNDLLGNLIPVNDSAAEIDLTLTDVIGDSNVLLGQSLRVDVYLANLGPDPAPGSSATACGYYTEVFLSTDPIITTSDISLGKTCHASLAGNSTNRFYKDVTVPADIPGGFYYWGAITDATEILLETDETNNAVTGNKVNVRGR